MQTKVNKASSAWTPANSQVQTFAPVRSFPASEKSPQFKSLQLKAQESYEQFGQFVYDHTPKIRAKTEQGEETTTGNKTLVIQNNPVTDKTLPSAIQRVCAEYENKEQNAREVATKPLERPFFQAKLTIGTPGDKYEQEADQVAQQVVQRINAPQTVINPQIDEQKEDTIQKRSSLMSRVIQRIHESQKEQAISPDYNDEDTIQKRSSLMSRVIQRIHESQKEQAISPDYNDFVLRAYREAVGDPVPELQGDFESNLNGARGGGSPLDKAFRAQVEPAMGADFSEVKVHTDHNADQLNRSIQAKAFTTGQDIFFRRGEYNPNSSSGQELLAHELSHVVQQSGNNSQIQRKIVTPIGGNLTIQRAELKSPRFSGNKNIEDAYKGTSYIKKGDSGLQVRLIQQALLDAGYSLPKHGVDGKFGPETKAAVKAFQKTPGLGLNDDGIVGPKTMKALDRFFLNHGAMAAIPQAQVPSTAPTEGVEWNSASIPPELLEGTRTLTPEEKAEVERRRTTEVQAPKGGSLPVFKMNIPTHTDSYETRVEEKTNKSIDWLYDNVAKGKANARKDPNKNLYKWNIIEKIALLSKAETDRVFGNYAKGKPFKANVNLKDAWTEKENRFAVGGRGYEDSAVEWRVNKIFGGRSIREIDKEHGAVQSRSTEKGILQNIRNRIISKRRKELIEIHKGWPGFAGGGKVYLQRFVSADDGKNRDNMWDLFQTVVHEYIHTLEHSAHARYRNSLGELKGGKTYREGMTEYFTKIVLESVTYNDSLRKQVEGPYHDPKIKHPIPPYFGYDEAKNAEAVVGVVGIRNAMAAFFTGRVDLIGG